MSFPSCCYFADTGAEYKYVSVMLKHIFVEMNAEFDVGMVLPESERFVWILMNVYKYWVIYFCQNKTFRLT